MTFKSRLNLKFYIVSVLLLCVVVFIWYGIYFLNTNEIRMEDNSPMDSATKALFTVLMSLVGFSWTMSLFALIRQIIAGNAFCMDKDGIHTTATAVMVLAFIFVIPIKTIPYDAIIQVSEDNGILSVKLDKSKIAVLPILRMFVRKEYHFFSGFTKENPSEIKQMLNQFVEKTDLEQAPFLPTQAQSPPRPRARGMLFPPSNRALCPKQKLDTQPQT